MIENKFSWLNDIALKGLYGKMKWSYESFYFDRYRAKYHTLTFDDKKALAAKWLKKYPEQAHFNYQLIHKWLREILPRGGRIIEIGGWRGDLAQRALYSFEDIEYWHNYDFLDNGPSQKCSDPRYKLITLSDYLWNLPVSGYNSLISTHMIEHINWNEMQQLIEWIPDCIDSVLFEAPITESAENFNWQGDHSSHILEKGWKQICGGMNCHQFKLQWVEAGTYVFAR